LSGAVGFGDIKQPATPIGAGTPSLPADVLAVLSKDENTKVRINVAKHRNTDSSILAKLSSDPDPEVRARVARNPNTPEASVRPLVTDRIGTVLTAAKQAIAFKEKSAQRLRLAQISR
jgi:hypothetical protein